MPFQRPSCTAAQLSIGASFLLLPFFSVMFTSAAIHDE